MTLRSKYNLVQEGMQSREKYFVRPNQSLDDIPKDVENVYFCRYGNDANWAVLDSSLFAQFRSITLGCGCFTNVRNLILDGLEKLESLWIFEDSFCLPFQESEDGDGICWITNCHNLRQLRIGSGCFRGFAQLEISNMNSLQSLIFDEEGFSHAEQCTFKGKP